MRKVTGYERRARPLLPRSAFFRRVWRHVLLALAVVVFAVGIGTVGYRLTGTSLSWLDAFLNASMILSGMGPVDRMDNDSGKLFSALYALFSGLVFIGVSGILTAPWIHRLLHWFHLESEGRLDR